MDNERIGGGPSLLASYQPENDENISRPEPLARASSPALVCEGGAGNVQETETGISLERAKTSLVDARYFAGATAKGSVTGPNTNAERSSSRALGSHAEAGRTAAGDSVYASGALLKGKAPDGVSELEFGTVSVQAGKQSEVQAGIMRTGGSASDIVGLSSEVVTARAGVGIHNSDGSTGLNMGASVTAGSFEATNIHLDKILGDVGRGAIVSVGVSAGLGTSLSAGLKTGDDGHEHLLLRAEVGLVNFGIDIRGDH
jgi:hypothetical protein